LKCRSGILKCLELEEAITDTRELASIIGKSVITAKRAQ
jgi:hypothetical protein